MENRGAPDKGKARCTSYEGRSKGKRGRVALAGERRERRELLKGKRGGGANDIRMFE